MRLKKFWRANSCLVVGVSGGIDSMVLLDLLAKQKHTFKTLVVAHVDHGMRTQSVYDKWFVEQRCRDYGVFFESNEDIPKLRNEQEAREYRYRFFNTVLEKYHATHLVLAHHQQDQVETILMHLMRGKSLRAISGMVYEREYTENVVLVRPLLTHSRRAIESYQQKEQILFVEDETNAQLCYTRNRYRHVILPTLRQEVSTSDRQLIEFSQRLKDVLDVVDVYMHTVKERVYDGHRINGTVLREYPGSVQREFVQWYLEQMECLTKQNVSQVSRLLLQTDGERYVDLGKGKRFCVSYGDGFLLENTQEQDFKTCVLNINQECVVNSSILSVTQDYLSDSVATIDRDRLPVTVRYKKDGDKMYVRGMHKKVSRLCIDHKIPLFERKNLKVVVDKYDDVVVILHDRLLTLSKCQETGKIEKCYLNYKRGTFYD